MLTKLKSILLEGDKFYFSLSFDINDFIGDGIWWLQIYDDKDDLIYDKSFASSMFVYDERDIRENIKRIIKQEILYPEGLII